jgi:hypothetical protein
MTIIGGGWREFTWKYDGREQDFLKTEMTVFFFYPALTRARPKKSRWCLPCESSSSLSPWAPEIPLDAW